MRVIRLASSLFPNFIFISSIILTPTQKLYIVKLTAMSTYGVVALEWGNFGASFFNFL